MGVLSAFYAKDINLTTAHDNLEVVVGDFAWVQFWCDGAPHGITVAVETQAGDTIYLNRHLAAPVRAGSKVYVTNDVRSGRSKLVLYFSQTTPLHPYLGGEAITREELAARLGSIQTFDRRGEVIFADDFENGLAKWSLVGDSVWLDSSDALSGKCSVAITLSGAGNAAYVNRYLNLANTANYGVECSFNLPSANLRRAYVNLAYYDGTNSWNAALAYNAASGLVESGTGTVLTWTTRATGVTLYTGTHLFHTLKLVVDLNAHTFVRGIVDNNEYDLKTVAISSDTSAINPILSVVAGYMANAAASITGRLDNLIVTRNEP